MATTQSIAKIIQQLDVLENLLEKSNSSLEEKRNQYNDLLMENNQYDLRILEKEIQKSNEMIDFFVQKKKKKECLLCLKHNTRSIDTIVKKIHLLDLIIRQYQELIHFYKRTYHAALTKTRKKCFSQNKSIVFFLTQHIHKLKEIEQRYIHKTIELEKKEKEYKQQTQTLKEQTKWIQLTINRIEQQSKELDTKQDSLSRDIQEINEKIEKEQSIVNLLSKSFGDIYQPVVSRKNIFITRKKRTPSKSQRNKVRYDPNSTHNSFLSVTDLLKKQSTPSSE